ncbi:MAG: hypothetical protein KAS32_12145 [Candidatus Peribacteraceae bacterium]|nr:hypothetical protein [Candidatus Peribacteraceae bacterium]
MEISTDVSIPEKPRCKGHKYDVKVTLIPESLWDRLVLMVGNRFVKTEGIMIRPFERNAVPIYEYKVKPTEMTDL